MTWIYACLSVLLGSSGQLYLKLGGGRLLDLNTLGGVALYGISFLLWLKVLAAWPLSRAYPVLAANFVLVAVFSVWLLHERFTPGSLVGTFLCTLGVLFIGLFK